MKHEEIIAKANEYAKEHGTTDKERHDIYMAWLTGWIANTSETVNEMRKERLKKSNRVDSIMTDPDDDAIRAGEEIEQQLIDAFKK